MPKQFIITKILANIHQFFIFSAVFGCVRVMEVIMELSNLLYPPHHTNKSNRNKKKTLPPS